MRLIRGKLTTKRLTLSDGWLRDTKGRAVACWGELSDKFNVPCPLPECFWLEASITPSEDAVPVEVRLADCPYCDPFAKHIAWRWPVRPPQGAWARFVGTLRRIFGVGLYEWCVISYGLDPYAEAARNKLRLSRTPKTIYIRLLYED